MSGLSYPEKLLDGTEVEWKTVSDIAGYSTTKVDADKLDATSFVGVDNLLADKGGRIDATYQPNTARLTAYEPGDILLGNIRPYLKKIWLATNNGGCSGDVLAIRILADCKKFISPEYLYYALSSDSFFSYSMQHAKGAKMPRGSKDAILNYQIPIPCPDNPEKSLAIQSEIVRIQDKLSVLTAELTMRKKQYNYYRDQLLSFKEGEVEWKTLWEITEINTGQKPSEILDKVATFDYINAGTSRSGYTTMSNCDGDTVTTPSRGQGGIGFVGYQKTPFWLGPLCYKIKALNNEILINKFLFYTLQSRNRILLSLKKEGGVPAVNKIDLAKLIIPLPSLNEQKRIVSLLDKFDTLTNSFTEGLPREIELRQKQYEYYRDLLFNFPKPETVSN
ncbi:restriction endonuclease subunit S [Salmonella enterica subsp. enterica]|nr:restriction endonuclease subunit S [Salmonella enterica subsp. enterica]